MNDKQLKGVINEVFMAIFEEKIHIEIDELLSECAFDIIIQNKVIDAVKGYETWENKIN